MKEWSVPEERSESGREFQVLGAAAWKEREPKMKLVRETCKRLEEEDDNDSMTAAHHTVRSNLMRIHTDRACPRREGPKRTVTASGQ